MKFEWTDDKIDVLKLQYGTTPSADLALQLGCSRQALSYKARLLNLQGQTLFRLNPQHMAAIERASHKPIGPILKMTRNHVFECGHCGAHFETIPYRIAMGHTKSCGCVRVGKRTGGKYLSGTWLDRTMRAATVRNLDFKVSLKYLEKLLEKQDFKCALSGRLLICGYTDLNNYTASLDRIDSDRGYVRDNLQFLHKDVNMAKQDMSQFDFVSLCKDVAFCQT
jgi:biotin operon repressor